MSDENSKEMINMPSVVYISGPMAGIQDYNYPAFFEAERKLTELGMTVLNPAKNPPGLSIQAYMDIDIAMVRHCNIIATLPGWKESCGAVAEVRYAERIGIYHVNIDELIELLLKEN